MLVQVVGTRPEVSAAQALEAIATKYGVFQDERLEIHPVIAPFDFFV